MSAPRRMGAGDAWLFATVFVWGINFPFAKAVLGAVPTFAFMGLRWAVATALMIALHAWRVGSLKIAWPDAVKLAGLGFLGIFLFQLCWNFGLAQTTAGKASILVSTTPLFAALGAALIGRVPGPVAWAGMALGFGGVFLLINNSLAEITVGGGTWIGDVLMLIASIVWAFYSVYAVDLIRRLGALTATTWAMIFGTLMLLPFTLVPTLEADWAALAPETWGAFLFTSVFSAALSFFWWYEGVRLIGPEKAMLYSYLIPVFGVCAAAFLAGEVMSWVQLLGAVLALGGVALARRG